MQASYYSTLSSSVACTIAMSTSPPANPNWNIFVTSTTYKSTSFTVSQFNKFISRTPWCDTCSPCHDPSYSQTTYGFYSFPDNLNINLIDISTDNPPTLLRLNF
jgi:hypothetical protein